MGYKERVDELRGDLVEALTTIIKIPSVKGEKTGKHPFGENIDKVLVKTLEICEGLGFNTYYGDGYYGYAEVGEGDEILGILGHLDVVPEGERENWKYEPYGGEIDGDRIYGRGTQDDKGPTIAAIYAVKALMDSGIKFNKRVRFIFGTDEENLWQGITKYMEKEEVPTIGFTPDADFPMIYAEKGLLQAKLVSDNHTGLNIVAGDSFNAVPDKASFNGLDMDKVMAELNRLGFEHKKDNDKIIVIGKGAHGSKPQHGINAISRLSIALNNIGVDSSAVKFIAEVIGEDYNGTKIFGNCKDEPSGKLTINVGKLQITSNGEEVSIDIRYPVTTPKEKIANDLINKSKEYGLEYKEYDYLAPLYVPKDHYLIKTLRRVYEEETGLDSEPISIGGATYARAMKNCVAFGPIFPEQEKVEHQANEYIEISKLMKTTKIYASAIYHLTR